MGTMSEPEISRHTYKQIKGMDRAALNDYLVKFYTKAYATGFAAGKKAAEKMHKGEENHNGKESSI